VRVLVTGSSGLIGSEAVARFDAMGFSVRGVDNNMRADFFGPEADTTPTRMRLLATCPRFSHLDLDIRDRAGVDGLMAREKFDLVIHAAAQPSHDLAARRPFDDFDVNAVGTLNLLEACRQHAPDAVFIFMSTNKVYGDGPNRIGLAERDTRWDYTDPRFEHGIAEDFPIDQTLHSLFGASKVAADVLTQEYGRYFGMKTGVFRGGCLTGPQHHGVELHGMLSHLVRASVEELPYTVFGYKGKQVRDQIHARDVVDAFWAFAEAPRPGEVYNLGGGRENAASLIELVERIASRAGTRPKITYSEHNRVGDHICYYTDIRKLRSHYPSFRVRVSLDEIIEEMVTRAKLGTRGQA
jgi:CDP-paratose 2-epimerase